MDPRNILSTIRERNPRSVAVQKDIYNDCQKINKKKHVGETPVQILENYLISQNYVYETKTDSAKVVENIFFVHKKSYEMWRAFPHVLMIDATYKTNMYKLPFVQVVGVSSTRHTFCIAHAFISNEQQANFIWVLEHIKSMLHTCMEPRVIVTDRDIALMNACDKVFPDASKYLCRWHISENIATHFKKGFSDEDWKKFLGMWSRLCESPNPELYDYNLNKIHERLQAANRGRVLTYLQHNWLDPYKEKFVSAWSNKHLNFGQRTTNRVESQHANFKRYLKNANSSLHTLVEYIDQIVVSQERHIKHAFETSMIKTMEHHKIPLFDYLRGNVSHVALDHLFAKNEKSKRIRDAHGSCGHQLWTSCGLPCACQLLKYNNEGRIYTKIHFSRF